MHGLGKDPNATLIVQKHGQVTALDYLHVKLNPIMKFQKLGNFIPYLKDYGLSLLRTKVGNILFNKSNEQIKQTWKETRLLLVYFLQSEILTDHTKYIDFYNEFDILDQLLNYLVTKIIPKETELEE